ncbi:MAG: hypothetical protein ACRD0Y_13270 [Terriglobales bacterium]
MLSRDTSPEIEQRQIEHWRRMAPHEKLALAGELREAVLELARAGIRTRHPGIGVRECFLRLTILTLGLDLARKAYPEIDALTDPRP